MTYWHTKQVVTDPGMFRSPLKKKWRISWAAVSRVGLEGAGVGSSSPAGVAAGTAGGGLGFS
jgi:hypothetical protein